ncbi:unnamed protein product [Hermetia illucens]|uniref:Uncharacterized protein n=1 Tax=Hermetia illucens TaxID=343691 RepID=A0A7R8UEZ5_HERIL|nr:unnamed protein product [Hermetia illucens]
MSPLRVAWTIIISTFAQQIVCFIPHRQQIAANPVAVGNVPFPLQGIETDDSIRAVYNDGEDPFKSPALVPESEEFSSAPNQVDFADKMLLKTLEDEIREDQDVATKAALLMKLLEDPTVQTLPIVYMEDTEEPMNNLEELYQSPIEKRSRYYRRYPWKRQNSRHRTYEADTRYLCVPTREDVFKLLVGIHENRNGNHQKTVSFCNRKRPAKAIFTNIRFLG